MIREILHKILFYKEAKELNRLQIANKILREESRKFAISDFEKWMDEHYPITVLRYKKRWVINQDNCYDTDVRDFCLDWRTLPKYNSVEECFRHHIDYTSDTLERHHVLDFWQLPPETFALGAGDCDDSGCLKTALCRRMGNKDVFCALGFYGKMGHFFNLEWKKGEIYIVEPTTSSYNPIRIPNNDLKEVVNYYKIHYVFNENKAWTIDDSVVFGKKVGLDIK